MSRFLVGNKEFKECDKAKEYADSLPRFERYCHYFSVSEDALEEVGYWNYGNQQVNYGTISGSLKQVLTIIVEDDRWWNSTTKWIERVQKLAA